MKRGKKILLIILVVTGIFIIYFSGFSQYLTFENLKKNRDLLLFFVNEHYGLSVLLFIGLFISTAFFLPGAIIMSIAGGFFFGAVTGTLYINIGSTFGATLSFLFARYLIRGWVHKRFKNQLKTFHKEINRHSYNYLLVFRIIPILPSFLVNFLAGITHIPWKTFVWTTSVGVIPGSFVYAFAGSRLSTIDNLEDIFSIELSIAFLLLAIFILLPVFYDYWRRINNKR